MLAIRNYDQRAQDPPVMYVLFYVFYIVIRKNMLFSATWYRIIQGVFSFLLLINAAEVLPHSIQLTPQHQ